MTNFYETVIKKDPRFHSTEVCKDLALLEPEFRGKVLKFVTFAEARGHEVKVLETYRSAERQEQLFVKRLTQLRKVGVHGYGLAIDFGLYIKGVYDPKGQDYLDFVALAKKSGVISGIDWGTPCEHHSFHDYDHLQGVPVSRQHQLFAGLWYPPTGYDPISDSTTHHVV